MIMELEAANDHETCHSFDKESNFVTKEYSINVNSDTLLLNFVPSNNSFAFVNGIEVVSVPDDLIPDQAITLSHSTSLNGLSELAFETVYRLNMGGPRLTPQNDTLGRIWENDEKYLHVNSSAANVSVSPSSVMYPQSLSHEIAPSFVYATAQTMGNANVANLYFNVTWVLPVDPAFAYFVRVHFCDIVSESLNELLFNLYINSDNAYVGLDLSSLTGYLDVPVYKDFVTNSTDELSTLTVSIGPQADAVDANAILNGLEIFKISNRARSLDGVSAVDDLVVAPVKKSKKFGIVIGVVIGVVVAVILSGFCYFCVVGRGSKKVDHLNPLYGNSITMTKMSNTASCISLASCNDLGRSFSFQEILEATNKFDESLLLGVGGFGRVYRGTMEDGTDRDRDVVEAQTPSSDLHSLSWKQRLEICIGSARGLHYLHTGASHGVIHRDVKTTNILLDENFVAKVADFGLSKAGPSLDQTHVSTAVKGSFGYLDPEYFRRQQLTEKSDVYSFGVVLMEVLCARPALNPNLPRDQVNIAEWALSWQKKGNLEHVMDQNLTGKVNISSLRKYGEIAEKCLAEYGVDRPSMGDVLWNLEYALQLEETSSALEEPEDSSMNYIPGIRLGSLEVFDNSVSLMSGDEFKVDKGRDDVATSGLFSQMLHPRGR
uniref:Receptor-like protein kinase THESEUS 1 n=1 Tax=Tanacetum cinerariifolium TaxID=118510 RepID=A0A699HLG6_TANCI|nr:receptor-like protein kinase THESEUS 1 [Tanacetum cinerariifolium]